MALKIRLARGGAKGRPFYRVVVAEASSPRDGRFVERIGSYNPLLEHSNPDRIVLNLDRLKYWFSVGAQPTDRVAKFMSQAGLIPAPVKGSDLKQSAPKKKAQERLKEKQHAEEEAKANAAKMAEAAATPEVKEEPAAVVEAAPADVAPEAAEAPASSDEQTSAE